MVGNWTDLNHNLLLKLSSQPVYLVKSKETDNLVEYKPEVKRYLTDFNDTALKNAPTGKFIMEEITIEFLEQTLYRLKKSLWWNIEGFFFIKNVQTVNSCELAHSFFEIIWKFNILNVVFLCDDAKFGISLYSFNPYTPVAPKFFRILDNYEQNNGYLFTLLKNVNPISGTFIATSFYTNLWGCMYYYVTLEINGTWY